jgi:SsrA-binding protein
MKGSYVSIRQGEAFLVKAHISPYKQAMDLDNYDPETERKLLLHRKELNRLIEESQSQRLTIVPTAIGLSRGRIKLEIALARGKKLYDKRESKKQQTMLRDARLENTK